MGKLKTNKATAKRFKITGKKNGTSKVIKRTAGQDHFNARETGKTKRAKRSDKQLSKSLVKTVKTLMNKL
jgi:ribosomal protein L35